MDRRLESYILEALDRPGILEEQRMVLKRFDKEADKNEGLSPHTRKRQVLVIYALAKKIPKPFKEMQREDIEAYIYALELAPSSVDQQKISIKKFFKWLYQSEGYPDAVKWIKLTNNKKRKLPEDMLSTTEVRAMVEATDNLRDRALVSVLYESACRLGELIGIRQKDVKMDQYGAVIMVNGKTGMRRIRIIDSAPDLILLLNNHPLKGDDIPLFCDRRFTQQDADTALGRDSVLKLLNLLARRAGLKKHVHPHLFRHSRLTELARDFTESELKIIAGWVGESRMAGTYIHLSGADIDKKILEKAGLINKEDSRKEDDILKPRNCPRCKEINPATAKFCYKCGMALDLQTAMNVDEKSKAIPELFTSLQKNPIFQKLLEEEMNKVIGK